MKKLFIIFICSLYCQTLFAELVCKTTAHKYYAVYEINTYTCDPGYFLPANTEGCRACPSGYTCSGGTFTFNEHMYQGIVVRNVTNATINNVCAINFPAKMHAVYEPNSVTLNFDDDNGNIIKKKNKFKKRKNTKK